jgi:hypothetical protein
VSVLVRLMLGSELHPRNGCNAFGKGVGGRKFNTKPENLYNMDESGFAIGGKGAVCH